MFLPLIVENEAEHEYQQSWPWTVLTLLGLCLAVHVALLSLFPAGPALENVFYRFGVVRDHLTVYGFLTCTLLHGSWGHLLGNGFFLWIYGSHLERLLGWRRFLVLYVSGAAFSMLLHVLTLPVHQADNPAIGASGAISAVMGAFFVLLPLARIRCIMFSVISFRPIVLTIPAFLVIGLWFGGQLVESLGLLGKTPGIAFWAHVGGFAGGAVTGTWLYARRQREVRAFQQAMREPLLKAWAAVCAGDAAAAQEQALQLPEAAAVEVRCSRRLLQGVLAARVTQDGAAAMNNLALAFAQARDFRDQAKAMTAYLQLRNYFDAEQISPDIHRQAATIARHLKLAPLVESAQTAAGRAGLAR